MSRFRPLKYREVIKIIKSFGFKYKHTRSSHEYYEAYIDDVRRIVTVDTNIADFCKDILKSMCDQSGKKKKEWYAVIGI